MFTLSAILNKYLIINVPTNNIAKYFHRFYVIILRYKSCYRLRAIIITNKSKQQFTLSTPHIGGGRFKKIPQSIIVC